MGSIGYHIKTTGGQQAGQQTGGWGWGEERGSKHARQEVWKGWVGGNRCHDDAMKTAVTMH